MNTSGLHTRADWRWVEDLYKQFTKIVDSRTSIPPDIAGALAKSLGRVIAHYEGSESLFCDDLLALWSEIDGARLEETTALGRFRELYFDKRLDKFGEYQPPHGQRRRPKPFEAAIETSRRLIDINKIRTALSGEPRAAILGGSVSYGRFFNVTGAAAEYGGKSSDTDLLLVIPSYQDLNNIASALEKVDSIDRDSLNLLRKRITPHRDLQELDHPCIFSHKLILWKRPDDPILKDVLPGLYSISLHVFSTDDFSYLVLKDIPIIQVPEGEGFSRLIFDYRDTEPPSGRGYAQRSFSGIELGSKLLAPRALDGGFVTNVQVCLVEGGRYCPGLHQNLILPQFEMRWESNDLQIYLRMLSFRWKILERLRFERTKRPFEEQKLSLSHIRSDVFAPHITRRANRE